MKRLLAIATAFTMTAVMLAGCGSSTNDSTNTSAASEPAAQESVQPEAAESSVAETGEAADAQTDADKVYQIGICQLLQHDALDAATLGFKEALTDKLGEDKVKFDEQNASGDSATCATIINQFVSADVDLILANATASLQAAAAGTGTIPILGTSITDYATALEIDDWTGTTGKNISGTSDLAPLKEQAAMLNELFPDAKTIGLLYCSAEANSVYQADTIQEYLEGIKIIKSCGLSGSRFSTLDKALQAMRKIAIRVELASGILVQGASLVLQAGLGITIFIGTVLITGGQIELLPLLVLFMFSTQIYGPILAILSQLTSLFHLGTVTNRMRTLLTTPVMEGEDKDMANYDIELKNVTFGYNRDDVIKDVSFSIPTGSVTALVGPSGSGKSTISKLIARFWDVRKGQISIGGMDVRTIEPEHLMRCMSFVFQDVTLFNDTVFNNIRVGNMNATEEQVMAAAKAAYCNEFIQRLPDGYQTILGENGSTLSGGERQRISIARALLKDAPIILLDEATASLDPENEVLIQRAIAKLVEGKTVIMIAHRLRTVVDADQIIVLKDGKLVEQGTHGELMKKKGLYEKLYHIQQESLGWTV